MSFVLQLAATAGVSKATGGWRLTLREAEAGIYLPHAQRYDQICAACVKSTRCTREVG